MMDERVEWKILGMNIQRMTVRCVWRRQNDNRCELLRDVRVLLSTRAYLCHAGMRPMCLVSVC